MTAPELQPNQQPPGDDRRLLDALSDRAVLRLDEGGRIVTASAGTRKLFGYAPDELIGAEASKLFAASRRGGEVLAEMLCAATTQQGAERVAWLRRKVGRQTPAVVAAYPVRDEGGTAAGFALIVRDGAAEEQLRANERRLRLLLDCVQDYAICLVSPSGVVMDWNRGAERVLGYQSEEIIGRHYGCFYTAEDRAAGLPAKALERARAAGAYESDGWRRRRDGGRFRAWVVVNAVRDDAGALVGFAHIVRDITERRVAQEALRESERQFRLLVNGVADHALYMLDPNGVVISWNAGAERIKGYSADQVIGQHYSKFFTDADRMAGLPARGLYAAMENGRYEAEGWRVRRDGSLFWASVVMHAIKDDGALIGFAKITRDATERRQAHLELQKTQEQLFHAQKLEALGQLTGGVAHDFNNLLMIMGGQAELLGRHGGDAGRAQRAAEIISAAAARGATLTRQLLSFTRRQPLSREVVDLAGRLERLEEILSRSLGETIQLSMDLPPALWPVELDPNELELALINLAVNARDAMPGGGNFTIAAQNVTLGGGELDGDLAGEFVALTVADTGVGIPEDVLPKVFDPFFTTKQADQGTGLGLSQVYGFARQAGGAVKMQSTLGEGASVTLYLRRAARAAEPAADLAAEPVSAEGLTLVVEDNPDVAEVTADLVQLLGYRVCLANNAEAALEALRKTAFDLVVSDVVMTGPMDGIGLAREIRQHHPELPVLLVSGYSKALTAVADAFPVLQKPFNLERLQKAVADATRAVRSADPKVVRLEDARRAR
ncbi:MAG: PAS domain S-box protein [Caulobacteraceae bacterium]|nr:PAS domain S-box protein [Caulobacteraceae bacterium]